MLSKLSNEQLLSIAKEFGTPTYVYHTEKITQQFQALQSAFSGSPTRIFYACKALTNINILKHILQIGCHIDCSSINEVKLALHAGFQKENVLYTSNGIAFSEIEEAVALGVNINIDSLSNLEKFGKKYGAQYPVGIRLRPNIMAGGNLKISTGHEHSKFGIPIEQLSALLSIISNHQIQIVGLHVHTGSEIKDVAVFMQVVDLFQDLLVHFPAVSYLDMGGGFKVPYREDEQGTDIQLLGEKLAEAMAKISQTYQRKFEAWFEPGKFLVSESGYFLTEVTVLKETGKTHFVSVNSGFNHLIRPMFYEAYHRIENISNPTAEKRPYAVVGNICETDTFAWDRPIAKVSEGDILVMYNAGAYGYEMGSNYNARFKPAQVMLKDKKPILIARRDEFKDLLNNQIELP